MPHLSLEISDNIAARIDVQELCVRLHEVMVKSGVFPLGGIRVRAHLVSNYVIADAETENGFIDMVLRMGAGRSLADRKVAGQQIFDAATAYLAPLFQKPHFALSFEIREIDPELSWKKNSIHARLGH